VGGSGHVEINVVRELVVGAFEGQDIPNGAIIVGLGAVIGLTLNERIPGKKSKGEV
jgi:hypothetical protein